MKRVYIRALGMRLEHTNILLADSGGTKTDWIAIKNGIIISRWRGGSLHPLLLDHFSDAIPDEYLTYHLEFFGAGCHNENGKQKVSAKLRTLGFVSMNVNSDVDEAGLSLFGKNNGCGFISGTGSVIFEYDGRTINHIYGGLGHILGDEGSGFYFGKLLLAELFNNRLPKEIEDFLTLELGARSEILSNVYSSESKRYVSRLSELTNTIEYDVIKELHKRNIKLFVDSFIGYKTNVSEVKSCGSYVFHQRELFKEAFEEKQITLSVTLKNPLEKIAEKIVTDTL